MKRSTCFSLLPIALCLLLACSSSHAPWQLHTIDNTSKGADGAKLADVNKDGLLDIIVGWEQGDVVRIYRHPADVKQPWPFVEMPAKNVEDAQPVDLNGDGFLDIVSASEGEHQRIIFHWAPGKTKEYWESDKWTSVEVPCTVKKTKWMFARPMDVDGKNGIDIIVGSKDPNGTIGWLESPENPQEVEAWTYHQIRPAGWIMSIEVFDMDGDGQEDVLISDRKGPNKGVKWFKHPGKDLELLHQPWPVEQIGLEEYEPMFLDVYANDESRDYQIWVASHQHGFWGFHSGARLGYDWQERHFDFPTEAQGIGKSIVIGDVDNDNALELVTTYEEANKTKQQYAGVMLSTMPSFDLQASKQAQHHWPISDGLGFKFDFAQLVDIDNDGDLDVLTCEEANNATKGNGLGVVWYENPGKHLGKNTKLDP